MGKPICGLCGRPLAGVDYKAKTHTGRRPERPYGGYICHLCLEEGIRRAVRAGG